MIEVSAIQLIFLPLLFNLVAIFMCRLYYAVRDAQIRARYSQERIYRCGVCEHVYVDARDVPLSRCTRCGCLNEPIKR